MRVTLKIQRFNPEKDREPYFQEYEVDAEPTERLLSVLMRIRQLHDPTLCLRKSCGHGLCGSDAMVVNGKERLACKTLIKNIVTRGDTPIRIEPLRTLPIEKDLMVNQTRFFKNYAKVKPYFINRSSPPDREHVQSPEERRRFDDATNCILCASCYSACPVVQQRNPEFLGPAAIVQATRFMDDSRDEGTEERLPELDHPDGVWGCENHFECTRVCPRGIKVTKLINLSKRTIKNQQKPSRDT